MLLKITSCLLALIVGVFSQCNDKIHVDGIKDNVVSSYTVNGVYVKQNDSCDSHDVFYHSDNYAYLYHIGGDQGYWMIRPQYSCTNNDTDDGLVRAKSAEVNPGNIQTEWEEHTDTWHPNQEIEVTCYALPGCRYQLQGANDDDLNGYYDVVDGGNAECSYRDTYKHESREAYLYFVYSKDNENYYWVVSNTSCADVALTTAFLRNEDYTASPLQVESVWEERIGGAFQPNENVTVDCVESEDSGLSAGAIAGITIGCVAVAAGAAGGLGYYFSKRKNVDESRCDRRREFIFQASSSFFIVIKRD